MAVMMAKLYEALRAAGTPDEQAIAAAEEAATAMPLLTSIDNRLAGLETQVDTLKTTVETRFAAIESKFNVLLWAVGINAAATVTMLVKHW